ncbi:MAG: hypothetical protein CMN76_14595 [Spirochaetaceae bacterium]|nr:hypothetical protein [Spirochaetaceae bacterium]
MAGIAQKQGFPVQLEGNNPPAFHKKRGFPSSDTRDRFGSVRRQTDPMLLMLAPQSKRCLLIPMKVELANLPARLRLPLTDMLQSMVGREVQGKALDSGIPGQVIRLHLGGQMLKALLQVRGVQEGQNLFFRVEKQDGQFFLKLLNQQDLDVSRESSAALRDFVMKLGPEKLQFFHSLTELFKYWRRSKTEANLDRSEVPTDKGAPMTGASATGDSALEVDPGENSKQEATALSSGPSSPAFWAMTASLGNHQESLFVFYSDSADFQTIRLLIVQPEETARQELLGLVHGFRDPSIAEIAVLSRFPDPSFFSAGQLWQA